MALIGDTVREHGGIDILVNNAGVITMCPILREHGGIDILVTPA